MSLYLSIPTSPQLVRVIGIADDVMLLQETFVTCHVILDISDTIDSQVRGRYYYITRMPSCDGLSYPVN